MENASGEENVGEKRTQKERGKNVETGRSKRKREEGEAQTTTTAVDKAR